MSMDGIGKNKIDLSKLKGGFELKSVLGNSKWESVFRALDSDGNGVLDGNEMSFFFELADSDNADGILTGKEAKAFIKGNADLKDAKIKKEDILEFLAKIQENSENIDSVEVVTVNGEKTIVIKYKDLDLKQKTFHKNGDYETVSENAQGETVSELRNSEDVLLEKTVKNGETTETTEYEADGTTEAKVTLKEGNNKKTVTNFEQGVPTKRVVNENNTETTYLYNTETKSFDKTKEVLNKGIDALEQTTVFNPNLGVSNRVINKDDAEITTTYLDNEFISRHAVGSNYDEETKWDESDGHGFVTNRTYKNGDSSVCYSNTEDLNTRTYEKRVINGQTYEVKYDGNGGTYVVVQYGETFKEFCKHMGVSAEELKKANENNPDFHSGRQGATVIVPKYIAPDSNKFKNRKPASEVQALLRRDAQRQRDIRNGENSKTEMTITLQDAIFRRNYNRESHTFPKDMDWKWVAKWLYTKEGAQSFTSEQIAQRAKILADLNPDIKDGEIYGKPIKVKYDTSELEAKEEQRKQAPFTPDSSVHTFRDLAVKIWKMEHPYDMYFDYHNGFEIGYREEVLRKMNPDIKDGELAGKSLQVTIAPTSGTYQTYHTKKTDTEVGQPIVSALLKNQGKHSQAKLNALAQITTKEEFESYQRCADGQKKQHGHYKMETWLYLIPEEDRDTFVQKWYKQGILDDNDMINLQANKAYWAIRDACDGLNVFSNSEEIRQAVKLITDPTGQNNPEYAQKVYETVDTRITVATRRENIWSGKTLNLKEYISDEFWVFESDRDNYDLNLVSQGAQEIKATPRAGETQEQANTRARIDLAVKTFKSATIDAGTNEHSMQDVLKFLKNKEEFEAFKKAIKNDYSWNGYKDAVQYALYDELSLEEIGKMNELMISKGFYDGKDADEVRAYYKVQVLKDGDYGKIENVFKTISSKTEFDLINKKLNGGFVNYVKSHFVRPGQNYNMILASAGKYLSKNEQIEVAYNLLSGNGSLFMNTDIVSLAFNCIQSEEVAKAVDVKLSRQNTSIDELRKEYCRNEDTKMADRPLMEAKVPARLSAEQIKQNKETVRIFEEQLADFEARYNSVKDSEGALSEFLDGFFGTVGMGISNDEIDKLIAYDKETLEKMRLAAEGRLEQYRNGARENISLEDLIKLRASNIVRLSGATSVTRTTSAKKVGATNEEIAQMEKDMNILATKNECEASLLTSWNYISKVNSNSSDRDLAKAIEDTIANLNNYSTEDFQISLPINYVFEDGIIKDRLTKKPIDKAELLGLVRNLRKGLSDITKEMLGVEIPANTSYSKAKEIFNKTFEDKERFVTKTYEKAYGRTMPENILEKHSKYIGYGKMFVQVASTILVTIGTAVATGGSSTALFLTAAGTSLTMNSVDQITSANGITKAEGDEVLVGALFDGLLTFGGFKVGAAAEKFVNGEFKIARSVLATNTKTIRRIAPSLSTKSVEKASIIIARAQAAGFEITSDTIQSLIQQYCTNGEINEEEFIMGILMSAGGNTAGHVMSIRGDIKAKSKKTPTPQGIHSPVETETQAGKPEALKPEPEVVKSTTTGIANEPVNNKSFTATPNISYDEFMAGLRKTPIGGDIYTRPDGTKIIKIESEVHAIRSTKYDCFEFDADGNLKEINTGIKEKEFKEKYSDLAGKRGEQFRFAGGQNEGVLGATLIPGVGIGRNTYNHSAYNSFRDNLINQNGTPAVSVPPKTIAEYRQRATELCKGPNGTMFTDANILISDIDAINIPSIGYTEKFELLTQIIEKCKVNGEIDNYYVKQAINIVRKVSSRDIDTSDGMFDVLKEIIDNSLTPHHYSFLSYSIEAKKLLANPKISGVEIQRRLNGAIEIIGGQEMFLESKYKELSSSGYTTETNMTSKSATETTSPNYNTDKIYNTSNAEKQAYIEQKLKEYQAEYKAATEAADAAPYNPKGNGHFFEKTTQLENELRQLIGNNHQATVLRAQELIDSHYQYINVLEFLTNKKLTAIPPYNWVEMCRTINFAKSGKTANSSVNSFDIRDALNHIDKDIYTPEIKQEIKNTFGVDLDEFRIELYKSMDNKYAQNSITVNVHPQDKTSFVAKVMSNNTDIRLSETEIQVELEKAIPFLKDKSVAKTIAKELKALDNNHQFKLLDDLHKTLAKWCIITQSLEYEEIPAILKQYNIPNHLQKKIQGINNSGGLEFASFILLKDDVNMLSAIDEVKTQVDSSYKKIDFDELNENIRKINEASNQDFIFSNTPSVAKIPQKKVIINGKEYSLKVLDLTSEDILADLPKYGFQPGTKPEDIEFIVHMVSPNQEEADLTNIYHILTDKAQSTTLSTSLSNGSNRLFSKANIGIVLDYDQNSILGTLNHDMNSGFNKQGGKMGYYKIDSETPHIVKDEIMTQLGLNDQEYSELTQYLREKRYLTQIGDIKIGNKYISGKDIQEVLKCSQRKLFEGVHQGYNEVLIDNPDIKAIYIRSKKLSEVQPYILEFAQKYNLPIIVQ